MISVKYSIGSNSQTHLSHMLLSIEINNFVVVYYSKKLPESETLFIYNGQKRGIFGFYNISTFIFKIQRKIGSYFL